MPGRSSPKGAIWAGRCPASEAAQPVRDLASRRVRVVPNPDWVCLKCALIRLGCVLASATND